MSFDLDSYENVKSRKARFYKDHVDARITCEIINSDIEEKAIVRAFVFYTGEDQAKNLPAGIGHALEVRDKTKPLNKYGKEYDSVNYTSWLENAEESAVGRALDNAGYASNGKCSKEEMEKASRNASAIQNKESVKIVSVTRVGENNPAPVVSAPLCCGKAMMVSKFDDRDFGIKPWFCLQCKKKVERPTAAAE